VSSCSSGEEEDSTECGRASASCCGVSFGSSSMIAFCRKGLDFEELEGVEETDIVKISTLCSLLGMAGALKNGKWFRRNDDDACFGGLFRVLGA
jgi:hypothetical protein